MSKKKTILEKAKEETEQLEKDERPDKLVLEYKGSRLTTAEELLADAGVDMDVWEIERCVVNGWEVTGKARTQGTDKVAGEQRLWKTANRQIKVWLRKKCVEMRTLEELLRRIESSSVKVPAFPKPKRKRTISPRRVLEISPCDPHVGLRCHKPASDQCWSIEECHSMFMESVESILELAAPYGPFERVLWVFGNDFLHSDNVFHTTTAGTHQPESEAWHHTYVKAEELAFATVERLLKEAPVEIIQTPGNHDRQSSFTLGRVLKAYYHKNSNVTTQCGSEPYKFFEFGNTLLGFEHGHSIPSIRLAALMANECPDAWARTAGGYREWHRGDQHRKGSSKPTMFEEQGVSVEFLPGLTPPNEWHKLKGYNWQKRGAFAYVLDYDDGPIARTQFNINSRTGKRLGT